MILRCFLTVQVLQLARALDPLPAGSCAFEDSTCGYETDITALPWILNKEGHYISVDTSQGTSGDTAVLLSPELYTGEWSCIRLIYQIASASELPLDSIALNLYLRVEGESFDHLLWTTTEHSESWLIASLDVRNRTDRFKIVLEGVLGTETFASVAIFEIRISTGYCIDCDFEENHLCGFMNRWNPNVNWFVGGGNIGNSESILPKDHTFRNEFGHYMYVDSLYVKHFQEVAQLVSPKTLTPMSGCLSFYYQVQRENGIVFTVYTRDVNGFYEELWKADSPVSNDWLLGEVDFSAPYPMEVIFEVAFNSAKGGYLALDDISFSPVFCSNQTGISFSPIQASCTFDEDFCHFYQDHKDGPGWSRVKVKPNAYRPGDHTTGMGFYLLANTKFTSQPGYIGRLYSPTLPENLQYCLRFYYALYGFFKMRDSLAVYIFEENHIVQEKIWSVSETPRGVWTQAEITFRKPMPCKVVFMSWCRSFWDCGIVALDDVSVNLGSCHTADILTDFPGECTFEKNECAFTQQRRNRHGWHRRRSPTPTSYTGPRGDHTTGVEGMDKNLNIFELAFMGNSYHYGSHFVNWQAIAPWDSEHALRIPNMPKGYYMYIEASNMIYGQKAQLVSRLLRKTFGHQCLIFFYHMYGSGTGLLNVYLKKHGAKKETLIWKRRGEQSISWLKGLIEYTCETSHQIIFEAIRGISIRSDIAIDDISFQRGPCKEMEETTLQSSGYSADFNEIEY